MTDILAPTQAAAQSVELFQTGLAHWDIVLSEGARSAFTIYADMLVDWNNTRFNLTRLVEPEQIALNHFLDSVVLSQFVNVPHNATLIDVGTGPGFPGLPFKILRPDIHLVLIESTAKKLGFCKAVAENIGLTNIEFVHGRAEDPGIIRQFGRTGNIVTARAVAPLKTLLSWTAPLVASNGAIVAWKGSKVHEEIAEAQYSVDRLYLKLDVVEQTLTVDGIPPVIHNYVICHSR